MTSPADSALHLREQVDGRAFDVGLQCSLKRLEYDPVARIGVLWLGDGECTDMRGAISVFERIDHEVQAIFTWAGHHRDTAYHRTETGWRAVRIPPRKDRF